MRSFLIIICSFYLESSLAISSFHSAKNFSETSKMIEEFIQEKGLNLFAIIDHAENAKKINIKLSPNKLFIFGNPKVGSPLIQTSATMGLDLPVKVLIHVNSNNEVIVSYNNLNALAKKHNLKSSHSSFQKIGKVLSMLKLKLQ